MWNIVGGDATAGIIVREGRELSSHQVSRRLCTGAVVQEIELLDERLHYRLAAGTGPVEGWISLSVKGKALAEQAYPTVAWPISSTSILVIGGTGYIGRALVARLLTDGHKIIGLGRNKAAVDAFSNLGVEPRHIF